MSDTAKTPTTPATPKTPDTPKSPVSPPEVKKAAEHPDRVTRSEFDSLVAKVDQVLQNTTAAVVETVADTDPDETPVRRPWTHVGGKH